METVKIDTSSPNVVHVPTGTVCFKCTTYQGSVKEDATFSINNETVSSMNGAMVVNGTLVVTNSQDIFNAVYSTQIQCKSQRICHQILVYYDCK